MRRLSNLDISSNNVITELQSSFATLNAEIDNIATTIDFTPYAQKATVDATIETVLSQLHSEIANVTAAIPDVSGFATNASVAMLHYNRIDDRCEVQRGLKHKSIVKSLLL